MRYFGGKYKISKRLSNYINKRIEENDIKKYYEPFCGSCWVTRYIECDYIQASDACKPLILLWQKLQEGWVPPVDKVNKDLFEEYKEKLDMDDPMTAFLGFGCSFGGQWFMGFAESKSRDYPAEAKRSLLRKIKKMPNVNFKYCDYRDIKANNSLIYCDPPYEDSLDRFGNVNEKDNFMDSWQSFNSKAFWEQCREWSKNNIVLISSYEAPEGFKCVQEYDTKVSLHTKKGNKKRKEKVFEMK